MNKLSNLIVFSCLLPLLIISCGGEAGKSKPKAAPVKVFNEYTANRDQAASVIEYRKEEEGNAMAFLVTGYYEYEFVYQGEMSAPGTHKGEWLKFQDDFTYTFGKYGKQNGSGKYHYGLKGGMLVMLDDDQSKSPKEYELKTGSSFIIMVGRNTYGNNAVQIKLQNVPEIPKK